MEKKNKESHKEKDQVKMTHKTETMQPEKKSEDLTQLISEAAYDMFVRSGFVHGNDKQDWLRAEKMIYNENEK